MAHTLQVILSARQHGHGFAYQGRRPSPQLEVIDTLKKTHRTLPELQEALDDRPCELFEARKLAARLAEADRTLPRCARPEWPGLRGSQTSPSAPCTSGGAPTRRRAFRDCGTTWRGGSGRERPTGRRSRRIRRRLAPVRALHPRAHADPCPHRIADDFFVDWHGLNRTHARIDFRPSPGNSLTLRLAFRTFQSFRRPFFQICG